MEDARHLDQLAPGVERGAQARPVHWRHHQLAGGVITLFVTAILVVGIKESARFQLGDRDHQVAVVLLFIAAAAPFIRTENWHRSSRRTPASSATTASLAFCRARPWSSSRTSASTPCPRPHKKRATRGAIYPSAFWARCHMHGALHHRVAHPDRGGFIHQALSAPPHGRGHRGHGRALVGNRGGDRAIAGLSSS